LIGIGVVGYLMSSGESPGNHKNVGFAPPVTSRDSQLTPAKNIESEPAPAEPAPAISSAPLPKKAAPAQPEKKTEPIIVAQAATPKPEPANSPASARADVSSKVASVRQVAAEKQRTAEQAREALAAA